MTRLCSDIVEYVGHRGKRGHTGPTGPTGPAGPSGSGPYQYTIESSRSIIPTGSTMGNDSFYSSILSGNGSGITGSTSSAILGGNTCSIIGSYSSGLIGNNLGMSGCSGCFSTGIGNTKIDSSGSFLFGQNNFLSGNNSFAGGTGNTMLGDNSSILSGTGMSGSGDNTAYAYNLKNNGCRILNTKVLNDNEYTYTSPDHFVILTQNTSAYTLTMNVPTLTDTNGTQLIVKVVNTGAYTVTIDIGDSTSVFVDSTMALESSIVFTNASAIDFSTFEFVFYSGSWYLIRSPEGTFSGGGAK